MSCTAVKSRTIPRRADARFAELLKTTTQPGLLTTFIRWRWSRRGQAGALDVIGDDLPGLRPRLAVDQDEIWSRLLAFAANHLAWAVSPTKSFGFSECMHEIALHKHLQLRAPLSSIGSII